MIKLNCDLGESFGQWTMQNDAQLMPFIDMANIACGFHAGDPVVIQRTIELASRHQVAIGAHPSYPDIQGFGRRSMQINDNELIAMIHYQVAALEGMAKVQSQTLSYIKPHGALYNDMMKNDQLMHTVLTAVAEYGTRLPLVVQGMANWQSLVEKAEALEVLLWFEAFADRRYLDDGRLMPRQQEGAVLDEAQMLKQVEGLVNDGTVVTASGKTLVLKLDTLCIHGDTPEAIQVISKIRRLVEKKK